MSPLPTLLPRHNFRIKAVILPALMLSSITVAGQAAGPQHLPATTDQLVQQFKIAYPFWNQMKIGKALAARRDLRMLPQLSCWLDHEDRHIRGNVAFIFARVGDKRGFEVINAILHDQSNREWGQGSGVPAGGNHDVKQQIWGDRYYAAHLLVELRDSRAAPIFIELLSDPELKPVVFWALGELGDKRATQPSIRQLDDDSASIRVLAILALEKLGAGEALPRLRALLEDHERTNFPAPRTVSEAAKSAVARLESRP